ARARDRRQRAANAARHQGGAAAVADPARQRRRRGPRPPVLHEPGFSGGGGRIPQQTPAAMGRRVAGHVRAATRRSTMGPLSGLKVIALPHVMAGPTCTLMLADMGADVVKIEKSPHGDDSRHMIPPKVGEETAAFLMMNR